MRFKLDENLPLELAELFREAGHDAVSVFDQGLGGARDADLARTCLREHRAIVTLDLDFADIRSYPPDAHSGIVVFRINHQARRHLLEIGARLLNALSESVLDGELWIVEESQIRVRR